MAGSIAKAYVQVIPSAEGIKGKLSSMFNSEMPSAGQSAGGIFGSSMVGKIKGLIAAAGIGKALGESLSAGGDLQQSLGGIETLFKDSASTVIANAEQAYKTAGMSANQYMETVTGFSASLLQSLDGDTVAAAAAADVALKDMADNANKMGSSMESIQFAYQGFAKQNYTMLDNLKLGYGGTKTEMERLLADAEKLTGIKYDIDSLSDVYSAIHVIQEEMGITGATANEAASTFTGSLSSMKAACSDLLANLSLGRDITPALTALGETVFTFVQYNLLPMVGNIFSALPEVLSSAFGMAIQGLNILANNAEAIVQMGVEIVTGIGSAIITAAPYLLEAAVNLMVALGNAILSTDWIQVGQQTIGDLRNSLDLAAAEILGTDGNIVQSVIDAIGARLPDLLENGGVMVNSLIDGILGALPSLVDSALSLCVSFINMLVSNLPNILNTGKTILLNVVSGIRQSLPSIIASAGEAAISLISGLVRHLPQILATGFDLIVSLIKGIGNAGPNIITAAGQVAKKVIDAIKNTDWLSLGKNIIQGLINGIGAMGGALWSAARSIARSALSAIKSALGIASPSKVMRDEVGKWIPSGVAVGIEANTKPLTNALRDMSDLTTDTMKTDLGLNNTIAGMSSASAKPTGGAAAIITGKVFENIQNILENFEEDTGAKLDATVSALSNLCSIVARVKLTDEMIFNAYEREQMKLANQVGGYV
jgi:phage-related protein